MKGQLTTKELWRNYIKIKKLVGCEHIGKKRCCREIRYIYFYEGMIFYQCCGYHKLKEDSKKK